MKRLSYIIIVLVLLVTTFAFPIKTDRVEAKTLRQLKQELSNKEAEYSSNKEKQRLTQSEITAAKNKIAEINKEIAQIQIDIENLKEEIEKLNIEIEEKKKEIKQIMNYYQLSSGENAYLEYVFNAADFTDFIYRMAIAEQLSSYNDKLIDEFTAKIAENERKTKELDEKTKSLGTKREEMQVYLKKLNSELSEFTEAAVSIEDEIKSLKENINLYQNEYKCNLDDDISNCASNALPAGTRFFRPVVSGVVSANFGYYDPFGYSTFHYGTDIAGSGHGAPVYASAPGTVSALSYRSSCGGNMVFINHLINGKKYTTLYAHLASYTVSVGQVVTKDTVIGYVGGNPSIEWWDGCSTGTHVHLQIATSWYPSLMNWSSFQYSHTFNAREVVNLPPLGTWFSNRYTQY